MHDSILAAYGKNEMSGWHEAFPEEQGKRDIMRCKHASLQLVMDVEHGGNRSSLMQQTKEEGDCNRLRHCSGQL